MGTLHEHIASYKIDLDIAGTKNTFQKIGFETEVVNLPYFDTPIAQKKFVRHLVGNEANATVKYNFDHPTYWTIVNTEEQNSWGINRGYRINTHGIVKVSERL